MRGKRWGKRGAAAVALLCLIVRHSSAGCTGETFAAARCSPGCSGCSSRNHPVQFPYRCAGSMSAPRASWQSSMAHWHTHSIHPHHGPPGSLLAVSREGCSRAIQARQCCSGRKLRPTGPVAGSKSTRVTLRMWWMVPNDFQPRILSQIAVVFVSA